MFTVVQRYDFQGKPLDDLMIRTVYAVGRATSSFLVKSFFGNEFIWIPINSCEPYTL